MSECVCVCVCVYYGKPLEPENHTLACACWRCEVSHTLIRAQVMVQYKLTSPRAACSVEGTARGRTTATSAPKPNQQKAHSQTAPSFVATPVASAGLQDVVPAGAAGYDPELGRGDAGVGGGATEGHDSGPEGGRVGGARG